ncbi:hypothetical protein [Marinilabilia sp.]|jgi:hypothetical protein
MKTTAIFSIIALALTININAENPNRRLASTSAKLNANFLEYINTSNYEEENAEVAEWMLDVDAFETNEEVLEIEEWMLDETAFEETEELVKIEDWMLTPEAFTCYGDYDEENIEIEDWMLNPDAFLKK